MRHLFAKSRLKSAKKAPAWLSDPRIEPPLPSPAPRCVCGTMYLRRRLDCAICERPAPEEAMPVYHRPPPPPPRWANGVIKKPERNVDRLHYRILCMTDEQVEVMLQMERDGKTQKEIAAVMSCDQSAISRALAKFPDTRATARRRLIAAATQMSDHVIKAAKEAAENGDGSVALEVLDRLDVLPNKKHQAAASGAPQIMVVVGAPPNTPVNVRALPVFEDAESE